MCWRTAVYVRNEVCEVKANQRGPMEARPPRVHPRQPDAPGGGGNLLAETRRRRILDWLQEEGSARVSALSEAKGIKAANLKPLPIPPYAAWVAFASVLNGSIFTLN